MRLVLLFMLGGSVLLAQDFRYGIKGSIPFTDSIESQAGPDIQFSGIGKRLGIGPTVEYWHTPLFGVSADLLYRRINFDTDVATPGGLLTTSTTTGNSWEVPIEAKTTIFRNRWDNVRPVIGGGISFRGFSNVVEKRQTFVDGSPATLEIEDPPSLVNGWTPGLVLSAAVELGGDQERWRIVPQLRYTVWFRNQFDNPDRFNSAQNQFEIIFGLVF